MTFALHRIEPPDFLFSRHDERSVSLDKFRGLQRFGPYQLPPLDRPPLIGFVFPKHLRDLANRLYMAIRNGVGPYRGFANMFRLPLEKSQVFQISDFAITHSDTYSDQARRYADAIVNWKSSRTSTPDVFIVIHPRSPFWEEDTPYYQCKSLLLQEGILSQDVTTDLISHSSQFEWSVANIALATFTKLGGIPWVINRRSVHREIVLGVGRTHLVTPATRATRRLVAFTIGLRGNGPFEFTTIAQPAVTRQEYLDGLGKVIERAFEQVGKHENSPDAITLHLSKEFGWEEAEVIDRVVAAQGSKTTAVVNVLKITDEDDLFVLDNGSKDGIPARGTCVQVGQHDFVLCTEGREDKLVWRNRPPTGLRVRSYGSQQPIGVFRELLSQVFDLSQVNYRGFNATSRPVSLGYSTLIARLLAHLPQEELAHRLDVDSASSQPRMWFL